MTDWKDISSAPDDKNIMVFNKVTGPYVSHKMMDIDGEEQWPLGFWNGDIGIWYPKPTHWMPLPQPPKDS